MNRQACAIVLTRGEGSTLEVFLALRSLKLAFLGGFHAFPGGTLAKVDEAVPVANASPEVPAPMVSCAARELLEECGIVVQGSIAGDRARIEVRRRELLADEAIWTQLVTAGEVVLDGRPYRPFGRWVTPPFAKARFDALYLRLDAAKLQPEIWPGELDEGAWYRPKVALAEHDAGRLWISYPVLETLRAVVAVNNDLGKATERVKARGVSSPTGGEMLAGLHAIPLKSPTLPPSTHTNVYVLGVSELIVVDPAPTEAEPQGQLIAYIEKLLEGGARLKEIWLTHQHIDHVGSAMLLRDRFAVPVAAHELTARDLGDTVKVDRFISDGETTRLPLKGDHFAEWRAVFTPGHARGHLAFFDDNLRTLLAGDLMASLGTVIVAPPDGDMRDYMASLERVRALQPRLLFPAHGPPVAAGSKIDEYIAHRLARENAILASLDRARTPEEIVPIVYTDVPVAMHTLAAVNVRAHLDKLEAEQRVRKSGERYTRV